VRRAARRLRRCPASARLPPIVFVPGNGDTAGLWITTLWRFESNGWPRERLHAMEIPYPLARDDDTREQPGRSSTAEHMSRLAAEVKKVLAATGASRVALVGNSRGGYAIRNFIANGGGAAVVSHVVLGGVPNHGVFADPRSRLGSEFNGAGPFLTALNAPPGAGDREVPPGIAWMTIRSDNNDKFAQPTASGSARAARRPMSPPMARRSRAPRTWSCPASTTARPRSAPGPSSTPSASSPADRRRRWPSSRRRASCSTASSAGSGSTTGRATSPPTCRSSAPRSRCSRLVRAPGERTGAAVHAKTIGSDGRWGPFAADGAATYEFVVAAPGYATTHIYRSPFPRSSSLVSLRPERLADADRDAQSLVVLTRPRGYFGVPRDRIVLDGASPPAGIPSGVAGVSTARLKVADPAARAVAGEFNGERIVGRTVAARRQPRRRPRAHLLTLAQLLFTQGFGSRRECGGLIAAGAVAIGGRVLDDPHEELDVAEGLVFSARGEAWSYRERALLVMTSRPTTSARRRRAITPASTPCCRCRCAGAACRRSADSMPTPPACSSSPTTAA
jgi:pimeloyl-ACP methyl ester carboxylesterase